MKKTIKHISSIILMAGILFSITSCGTTKKAASGEGKLVNSYCSGDEFNSTAKAFRFTGIGQSMNQMMSVKKAISEAHAGLAASINTKVKSVIDNYVKSGSFNNKEELLQNYEGMTREVVDQNLAGSIAICTKTVILKDGNYQTYVCMELGSSQILESLNNKVSNNEMLKVDYNYEKFKKTFEEEMNKNQ